MEVGKTPTRTTDSLGQTQIDVFIKRITNDRKRGWFGASEDEDWEYILNYVESQKKLKMIKAKKYQKIRKKNEELQSKLDDTERARVCAEEREVRKYQQSIPDYYDIANPFDIESVVDELEEENKKLKEENKKLKMDNEATKRILNVALNRGGDLRKQVELKNENKKLKRNQTNLPAGRFTER